MHFLDLISQQNVEKNSIQHLSRNNNLPKFCCVMFIWKLLFSEKLSRHLPIWAGVIEFNPK